MDKEVIKLILTKKNEINSKMQHAAMEIMRLGYDTDEGKEQIPEMVDSISCLLWDLLQKLNSVEDLREKDMQKKPERHYQKHRKKIDIGKIIALKNAGWSNEKIADEMGMTAKRISQAIYYYRKNVRT